ncbi:MAG TPA: glycosyltransferase [Terrimicrobiaceae bacterium]|nr:glycosyltransferase [Terrimicrobiaceae bacterium]
MSLIQSLRQKLRKPLPVITLKPEGTPRGVVSFSYITWPFVEGINAPRAMGHTNPFECVNMAESYREIGYEVQVVDYTNRDYVPPPECRVAIDIHSNLERWDKILPRDCLRVLHATGSHWLLWNHAELTRLSAIRDRKGIALSPRRHVEPSRGAEVADHITILGNEYTINSFRFAGKPITRIPLSSAVEHDWPEGRDFEKARRKFLWLGSYGMVHKGLDLVLDAFAGMPDLELTVCGRPEKEEDFHRLYEKELRKTPNIRHAGWMDMTTPAFVELARTHASIIYPSAAEGGAGSVLHAMHAGMIPLTTWESSVDLGDFGVAIARGDVESVQAAARRLAGMTAEEVGQRARAAYDHIRSAHTRPLFAANYRRFAKELTAGR